MGHMPLVATVMTDLPTGMLFLLYQRQTTTLLGMADRAFTRGLLRLAVKNLAVGTASHIPRLHHGPVRLIELYNLHLLQVGPATFRALARARELVRNLPLLAGPHLWGGELGKIHLPLPAR